jgi:predicted nuclease of predicted toxin-antitoxin system
MKILLDENIPHDLRRLLAGYDVFTVTYMGWCGIENGKLLRVAAENGFDAMVTKDAGVAYEQHLATLPLAVIILKARTNKLDDIRPLVPDLIVALKNLLPKTVARIG